MTKLKTKLRSKKTEKTTVSSNTAPRRKPPKRTKKARLISLLIKNTGSNITSISKRFGWLPHTTRAALSGLRKAGYEISSMRPGAGKPTKYRITNAPAEQGAQ